MGQAETASPPAAINPTTSFTLALAIALVAFGVWYFWVDPPTRIKVPPLTVTAGAPVVPPSPPPPASVVPPPPPPLPPVVPPPPPTLPPLPLEQTAHVALTTPVDVSVAIGTFATRDSVTVDGVKAFVGMRVLLMGQPDRTHNGIWVIVELFQLWLIPNRSWDPAKHFTYALLFVTGK